MNCLKKKTSKRAAFTAALFFGLSLLFSPPIFAKDSGHTETYRDLIEKAYNLSLQKDRTQAVGLLIAAIKREGKKSSSAKELLQALEKVSTIFYSDKAQQLYELGISLKASDLALALSKLQEADRLEPENMEISLELARLSMAQNDCDAAVTRMKKMKDLTDLLDEPHLVLAQAEACAGQLDDYQKNRAQVETKKSPNALYWQMSDVVAAFKAGNFSRAREGAATVQAMDSHFPEAYYWSWKAGQELKTKGESSAQKYLNSCKTLSPRQLRDYSKEPTLCRHTTEVETFLKKMNNSEL
jgi:hypothetical protein